VTDRPLRWFAPVLGALLVWGALGFIGYAAGWTVHKDRAQSVLGSHLRPAEQANKTATAPCVQSPPQVGQLAGTLTIPAIGLKAPVEEGTDDAELNVAAGHAPASVWPGAAGSSVFLAHDVSYFVHLNALKPGDLIYYQDQCSTVAYQVTGQQVVNAGDPVYNSTTPTMVLDTCWPTNALFYTSQRLLVSAAEDPAAPPLASHGKLVSGHTPSTGAPSSSGHGRSTSGTTTTTPQLPAADTVSYTVPAPTDLVAQGLTLTQNEAPMGTMTLTGDPSPVWEESPGPLALTAAGLQAYFGGIHSAEQVRNDWWAAIAPGVVMPGPLANAQITGHDSPLDIAISSVGGVPQSVTMTTDVTVSGGSAPGSYHLVVTGGVTGSVVTITSWEMNHA
jgi:sortase A